MRSEVVTVETKKSEAFLRKKMADFDFKKFTKKEIQELVKKMTRIMLDEDGIGLAANQIGLNMRVFVAKVDRKLYAIFNPEITKFSKTEIRAEEGCLSVRGIADDVFRSDKITLDGYDKNGRKINIKAFGILARVFQHEVDHLNGILFIDRVKKKK